jgi:hypothetical protein
MNHNKQKENEEEFFCSVHITISLINEYDTSIRININILSIEFIIIMTTKAKPNATIID